MVVSSDISFNVGTGGEGSFRSGQNDGAYFFVLVEVGKSLDKLFHQFMAQCIEYLRSVKGDNRNCSVFIGEDISVGCFHLRSPALAILLNGLSAQGLPASSAELEGFGHLCFALGTGFLRLFFESMKLGII